MHRKLKQVSEVWLAEIPDATNNIIDVLLENNHHKYLFSN